MDASVDGLKVDRTGSSSSIADKTVDLVGMLVGQAFSRDIRNIVRLRRFVKPV